MYVIASCFRDRFGVVYLVWEIWWGVCLVFRCWCWCWYQCLYHHYRYSLENQFYGDGVRLRICEVGDYRYDPVSLLVRGII